MKDFLCRVNMMRNLNKAMIPNLKPGDARSHYLCTMVKLSMGELNRSEKIPVVVVLENIRSMHNVGSVFRSADAFLIEGIYLCGYTARPPRKEIDKTALGATETVQWKYFTTTKEA